VQNTLAAAETRPDSRWLRPELVASWREIAAVLVLATGLFAANSAWAAAHGSSGHYMTLILTNGRLLDNLALESALLGLLLLYLRRRGWTPRDLQIQPGMLGTLIGFPLLVVMMIANMVTVATLYLLAFCAQHQYASLLAFLTANGPHLEPHSIQIGWTVLIVAVVFNAFFEEITCTSYMFSQFAAKRGPLFALLLTVLVRMGYHTYEGPIHMLGIGAVFLVVGACYWWTRNVWPLIVAHALVDLGSMAFLKVALG
jgi:membrane protease YdiL (CAAX protease family)